MHTSSNYKRMFLFKSRAASCARLLLTVCSERCHRELSHQVFMSHLL